MQYNNITMKIATAQLDMYTKLNSYSQNNKILGRVFSIGAAIADGALNIAAHVAKVAEDVAALVINLLGAPFHPRCKLNDAYISSISLVMSTFAIPAAIITAPIKIFHQIVLGLKDPTAVTAMHTGRYSEFAGVDGESHVDVERSRQYYDEVQDMDGRYHVPF